MDIRVRKPKRDLPALLVTLELEAETQARFEALRQRYFPADRNRVPAHVMLFHRLPIERASTFEADLHDVAADNAPFDVFVEAPYSIGRGVSYRLRSAQLTNARATLARMWSDDLGAQDREPYRPHVVVQNKVDPATAKATLAELSAQFIPFQARATAFTAWTYRAGTWHDRKRFTLYYRRKA